MGCSHSPEHRRYVDDWPDRQRAIREREIYWMSEPIHYEQNLLLSNCLSTVSTASVPAIELADCGSMKCRTSAPSLILSLCASYRHCPWGNNLKKPTNRSGHRTAFDWIDVHCEGCGCDDPQSQDASLLRLLLILPSLPSPSTRHCPKRYGGRCRHCPHGLTTSDQALAALCAPAPAVSPNG